MVGLNATSTESAGTGKPWLMGLMVFLVVLLFSVPQAALLPLLDRDEPRFAEASREMLQSGNFVVPTFNNEPRYAKPPLIYWCQAFSFTLFGETAFAARLPSVMATAGTALLLFIWGVELGSECIGMIAALAYPFCLQTMQQGRVATADALLIFFMTLTAYAGWRVITLSRGPDGPDEATTRRVFRKYGWGLVLAMGFAGGFLAKGPEALLPILPLLVCARRSGGGIYIDLIANFLLGLCLVLFWALPAYVDTNGDYWRVGLSEGIGNRMVTGMQGHGASTFGWYLLEVLFYYPLFFLLGALPLWPLLLTQRKKLFGTWTPDPLDTYLLLNVGLVFLVFTLMVTKLPHYTLPAFPLIALFFARRWVAADLSPRLPTQLAGGLAAFLAFLTLVVVGAVYPALQFSPSGALVRDARDKLTPDTRVALVDFQEPSAVWEMRRVINGYPQSISEEQVLPFLALPGPRAVLLSASMWRQIGVEEIPGLHWRTYAETGFNAAKGTFVDLVLVVKI